jgi:hypothetical protein
VSTSVGITAVEVAVAVGVAAVEVGVAVADRVAVGVEVIVAV